MKKALKLMTLMFIIVSSIFLINTTKSRYVSEVNTKNDVVVAIPQIQLDTSTLSLTTEKLLPGDSTYCEFYIKNYENSKVNEVLMIYYIDLEITNQGMPLNYTIYEITENSEIELTKTDEGFGPITLNYGEEEDTHYKIVFTWDESNNNETYADKQFSFKILVNATQDV